MDDEAIAGLEPDLERAAADRNALEHPVQPLRTGGSRGPVALVCVTLATLAVLMWQPWSRAPSTTPPSSASGPAAMAAQGSQAPASTPPPVGALIASPSPPPLVRFAPQTYVSLIDNEWTVVALLTPRLSSLWLTLVTDVDTATGRALIDSMTNEVIVHDDAIRGLLPFEPMGYDEAVLAALGERAAAARL